MSKEFDLLFSQYSRLVRSHLYRLGARLPELDDLFQEVFIKVWKVRDDLKSVTAKKAWVLKIATNTAFDYGRKRKLTFVEDVDQVAQIESTVSISQDQMDYKKLAEMALQILPWQQRVTVVLYYFEDFTLEEISKEQDLPLGTVKSRLNTAKEKMQSFLSQKGFKQWMN